MNNIPVFNPGDYGCIVFFTGAGMSAESGMHTYRGAGGIWQQYRWEEYACQRAFDRDPEKVLDFHELRRSKALQCQPHAGHAAITAIQKQHRNTWIVTQNIDGMHQRAGTQNVLELHGSLWRVRCAEHGVVEDFGNVYRRRKCSHCGVWLRPDITWFEDVLKQEVLQHMEAIMKQVNLFVTIGTSGVVFPAAIFPQLAKQIGATTVCINTEAPADPSIFDYIVTGSASAVLTHMFMPVKS